MLAVLLYQELVNFYTSYTFDIQCKLYIVCTNQNRLNNLNERNILTLSLHFFSIDGIPEKTFSSFPSKASVVIKTPLANKT